MASNDIRLNVDFVDHIKVKRLIRKLGHEGFYSLIKLFSVTAKMYPKGALIGCDHLDVEELSQWTGEPELFVNVLMESDTLFLEEKEGTLFLHEWAESQPWVFNSPERSAKAKKAIQKRWDMTNKTNQKEDNTPGNTRSNTSSNTRSNTPLPLPSPIPSSSPSPIPQPLDDVGDTIVENTDKEAKLNGEVENDPLFIELPLCSGLSFPVYESFVKELTPLYPAVDIKAQLRQMAGWLIGNPSKRKTQKGILRFVTNWLSTQQDKAATPLISSSHKREVVKTRFIEQKLDRCQRITRI